MIRESFNQGWYVSGERGDGSDVPVGPVTLPYDAMLFERRNPETRNGYNTGYFPGGVYRYSKSFRVPEEWRGRSATLEFEGVYMRSEVFVNGHLAGGRPSGYAVFRVALDDHLVYGADNLVEVVAHNDREPNSRWYSGSGIYRPVHLLVGDRLRVTPDGLRVTTSSTGSAEATVEVVVEILNDGADDRTVTASTTLQGPSAITGPIEQRLSVASGETKTLRQRVEVLAPELWSPESPRLYTATVVLADGDRVVDEAAVDFGIRTLTVDDRQGLRINGEPVKLRGAAIHHDSGVIGAHTLDAAEERRVRILKESGFNAIRSAHNPVSRATLRACDRHGILVMDELTDVWWQPKSGADYSEEFEQWWERDLESLVAKDFNHPSVVLYSIGNEIPETATARGIQRNREMAERTRELDPTRLVTNCVNGFLNLIFRKKRAEGTGERPVERKDDATPNKNLIAVLNLLMGVLHPALRHIVRLPAVDKRTRDAYAALDVAGYNYMIGRYRKDAKIHPGRVIVGSETGPTDTVAVWREIESRPHVIGDFTWTGWDYIGEAAIAVLPYGRRPTLFGPWPSLLAGEPVIDITGHRQTQSYLNEIVWHLRTDPYLAVQPVNHSGEKQYSNAWRSTNSIHSWSWEGCEGRTAVVEVYADAHRVELLLNGNQIGAGPAGPDKGYLTTFSVPYRPGDLTAVAYDADGKELGRDTLTSAGADLRLQVRPERAELQADGADLAYIPIALTDAAGTVRPLADRVVTVDVTGAGELLGFGSAQPVTDEGFSDRRHSTYWGRALAVVRAGHETGEVTVTVTTDGCEPKSVVIPVRAPSVSGRTHPAGP
ncbi:DUF4982 domain-containing protein [Frankia sp. AgB1.9]|uniref:glycoside hydrolase family 2 TIM barrel-domain containing protein n=1 Tax=unclassified Frankia TaxID=2632575 RepID=UPI001932F1D5|nr:MULTISPECIES: glycoside hydrolase family 2 TIM barrel-domain containing protein [unclassified Frankia]MBL7487543.1 DUF4982 domain-containing protein [Frankia sp. AgW1.1]MBL7549514.1 DUF4982 domain-containing protein [Frankia sp. AgB1.9]MBL7620697.1 DUF4982 domain-containing protein [Frankia sp. AgB1.8]